MKPLLPVLFALLTGVAANAQTPKFAWVKPIVDLNDSSQTFADLFDIQTNRNTGQTFVFGYFQGRLDFDSQISVSTPVNSAAYFLAKYGTDGTVEWVRKIGPMSDTWPPTDTTGGGVETDAAGNVYITGKFFGESLRFDATHELLRNCPSNCADIFVAKYGPAGDFLWVKGISGAKAFARFDADGLALAPDGSLYLSGNYNGTQVIYDVDQIYTELRPEGYFLARIKPDGELEWIHFLNQEGIAVAEQLEVAVNGDVWVGGYYGNGPIDFGNNISLPVYGNPNFLEYFLVRYNADGEAQEALNFNSSNELFFMPEIATTPDSSLLIVHDFRKTLRSGSDLLRQTTGNGAILTRYKADSIFLVTFIPYGNDQMGNIVSTPIASVAVGSDEQFVTGGYFGSFSLFTPGGNLQNQGCSDLVLLSGNLGAPWQKGSRFGSGGCEGIVNFYPGHSMRTDVDNNLYVCGLFAEEMNLGGVNQKGYGLFVGKMTGWTVGATEPEILAEPLSVQPNPTSGAFRIAFSQPNPEGVFLIYDVQGKTVFRSEVNALALDLHLSLPNGAYLCTFLGKKGVERGMMLVNKE